ncbi:MAG: S1C family serine protease [bacterium]|nr:S1C family serine protease [bacterium]
MNKLKEFFKKYALASVIAATAVFGLAGGVAGSLAARAYLLDAPIGNFDFSQGKYRDQGLVISNARSVIVQQDAKINETVNSVSASLVGIYKKQKPGKTGEAFSLDNFYQLNKGAGQGFIITSDGWIVTSLALDKTFNDYVVIAKDKKIYQPDKAVRDSLTGFTFIHVSARDFPVRRFAENQDIKSGGLVLSVNWRGASRVSYIADYGWDGTLIKSSDDFSGKLILTESVPAEFKGSVIFNLAGDALGLVNDQGEIEPMPRLKSAAASLFKNKTVIRPYLGINYINLNDLAAAEAPAAAWQKGAIIYNIQKAAAVLKNSPAETAGLLAGDIVMSVGGRNLAEDNDLAELIQEYSAGDKIIISIFRGGQERSVEVVLGELK